MQKSSQQYRLARKEPNFREIILAVQAAEAHVREEYARDNELPILLKNLLGREKTTAGITVRETLKKIEMVLSPEDHQPQIKRALDLLRKELFLEK